MNEWKDVVYDEGETGRDREVSAIEHIRQLVKMRLEECKAQMGDMEKRADDLERRRVALASEVDTLHRVLEATAGHDKATLIEELQREREKATASYASHNRMA